MSTIKEITVDYSGLLSGCEIEVGTGSAVSLERILSLFN